ncbi:AbiV family abortive infection protein [Micromonospora deserti]|uniref:AbiV family abortive infection protein n=1 Tax=Micromonospora deserti TaxID=2070366 RepID=UPI0018F2C65F|nr:AbiV family abortive infection protein [Micromonospora deserti]
MVELQDALLANADRLLTAALAVLDLGNVGLARSLAILAMEESGKAIAIHERRVEMAYAPEGEPFVNARLENLWASHQEKLELVHRFLAEGAVLVRHRARRPGEEPCLPGNHQTMDSAARRSRPRGWCRRRPSRDPV